MSDLKTHGASRFVGIAYRMLKGQRRRSVAKACLKVIFALEGGQYRSATARKMMKDDYRIEIGEHSYGEAFVPGAFSPAVKVGRYCSVGRDVRVFTNNHPVNYVSTHPYFYEKQLGVIPEDQIHDAVTEIGHDVWIGQSAILLPGCRKVGNGAIIGAGAVVTKDVPDYAVVGGNPAKIIKYRFSQDVIDALNASEWWNLGYETLKKHHPEFICNISESEPETLKQQLSDLR